MSLELTWGRWRRWYLRRFWPGYVRRMLNLRQGDCPDCTHDIIDPRDLKFYRNVCGHWFRPEDDRFAWRGRLRLARYGLAELLIFGGGLTLIGLIAAHFAFWKGWWPLWLVAVVALGFALFVLSFFRDPERAIPTDVDALLSPADGVITHLDEVEDADFPDGRAFRVSIFLSVFNVHVNRVPRASKVEALSYYPGEFLDARNKECGVRNEQFWIDLIDDATGQRIRVKQVAGAIARRIVCWLRPGEQLTAGQRLGMIKFGSRTDVLVPARVVHDIGVQVGDHVTGGTTILCRVR